MIQFQDLSTQYSEIKPEIDEALEIVLERGTYILGPEVENFEKEFASFSNAKFAVGVASGTDAITLVLKALGVGAGDEVITTPFTAIPTVIAILNVAGTCPVFADISEKGFGLDPEKVLQVITDRTRVILPVHLFGRLIPIDKLSVIAHKTGTHLVEDACQAHGARIGDQRAGTLGSAGCFSFYPTKNLGAYGDGGAVVTNDRVLADKVRILRDYGRSGRDLFDEVGTNSRLDELQAAILRIKLRHLEDWNSKRIRLAAIYNELLGDLPIQLPDTDDPGRHVYHLYVIESEYRDDLSQWLASRGIPTHVHYPIPVHLQPALGFLGYSKGDFPNAEAAADKVLSLPMHPGLAESDVEAVTHEIRNFFN